MLPMAGFEVACPESVNEAVEALRAPEARVLAGGTDLLPTLKRRGAAPERLVSLHLLTALRSIQVDDEAQQLRIGAGVTLGRLSAEPAVAARFPSLAVACAAVASPQIRNRATLGGNIHLDTRCRYVNQSAFWRGSIGGCLKADGDLCHVVPKGRRCVAALSADTVPMLIALGARLRLVGRDGEREVALEDYYGSDGVKHLLTREGELCTEVLVPFAKGPRRSAYVKWRPRASIDFPLVSVALRFDVDAHGVIEGSHVVAGALAAKSRRVAIPDAVRGRSVDDPEVASWVADAAFAQCKPLANLPYDPAYRRKLIRVLTRRAMTALSRPTPEMPR